MPSVPGRAGPALPVAGHLPEAQARAQAIDSYGARMNAGCSDGQATPLRHSAPRALVLRGLFNPYSLVQPDHYPHTRSHSRQLLAHRPGRPPPSLEEESRA